MAMLEQEEIAKPTERLFVIADLDVLPTELPSGPLDYELDDGRLIFVVPPGDTHGAIQVNIATQLKIQGDFKGHGKARTEVGVVLWRDPDCVLTPDILFIAKKSLPLKKTREGYLGTIPNLVVEVRSKNDSLKYIQRKVQQYLKAGVEIVWVPDSTKQTVTVYSADVEPKVYGDGDTLQLPELIPGFSMSVAEVFRE